MEKTKLKWLSGSIIKQGDSSSVFKLKLKTEDNKSLSGPAVLELINEKNAKATYDVEVTENVIMFSLDKSLPVGLYIVEVEHAGYVFPSKNSPVLTVTENLGDYVSEEVEKLLDLKEYIKKYLEDYQVGSIDLDELAKKLNIEAYDDEPIKAQISSILGEIRALKDKVEQLVTYDDTALKNEIKALSERLENIQLMPGPRGETGPRGLSGQDGKSAYQLALENGFSGTEQEWLVSLKGDSGGSGGDSERYGPTGWFLDRSVTPWQFRFDNGSSLTLGNVDQRAYIYSESSPLTIDKLSEYRVILSLMRTANGSTPISSWNTANIVARFWGSAEVTNPVNDSSHFDFSKAQYNPSDSSGPSKRNQPILIRCYYELGVFTEDDILSFGAVRK